MTRLQHVLKESTDVSMHTKEIQIPANDGTRLAATVTGCGPITCLLIHGFGDGIYIWDLLLSRIPRSFRVVAVDLRGHGASGWGPLSGYSLESHVDDVLRIIHRLDADKLIVIGHSLGASIALKLQSHLRAQILGMVIVDFGPALGTQGQNVAKENLRESFRTYERISDYVRWLVETRPLALPAALENIANKSLRLCPSGNYKLALDPLLLDAEYETNDVALWHILEKVRCPVLIVRGHGSAVFPAEAARRMLQVVRDSRLHVVPMAGHAVMIDNPTDFATAVCKFIGNLVVTLSYV